MEVNEHSLWPGWTTVGVLGQGSYGTVYEIRRDLYGTVEESALKVISIPRNEADLDEMRGEGYSEAAIAARLDELQRSIVGEYTTMAQLKSCPYIVQPQDIMMVPHTRALGSDVLIRMELLTPIKKDLARFQSEREVIRLARDLCRALLLCRERHIIHRDIKPENIFVSRDGTYKLGDFGIAKVVTGTMGGTVTGTYRYMAPEVYKGEAYGFAVDMYSLGMVLYWALNDRRMPFTEVSGGSTAATQSERDSNLKRFSGVPLPPPAHGTPGLQRIVLKAASYAVRDRYLDPNEMLADLERLERTEGVSCETEMLDDGYGTLNAFSLNRPDDSTVHMVGVPEPEPRPAQPQPTPPISPVPPEPEPAPASVPEEKKPAKKKGWLLPVLLAGGIGTLAVITVLVLFLAGVFEKNEPFAGYPATLTVTDQGDGTAMLTWVPVPEADGYIIRSETLGYRPQVRIVDGANSDVFLDSNALHMSGAEIHYTVTAYKDRRGERQESESCASAALTCTCGVHDFSVAYLSGPEFQVMFEGEHPNGVTVEHCRNFTGFETVTQNMVSSPLLDVCGGDKGDVLLYRMSENGKVLATLGAARLDAPASVSVSVESGGNRVTWEPCEGADLYAVFRETDTGSTFLEAVETQLLDEDEAILGKDCRYTVFGAKRVQNFLFLGAGAVSAESAVQVPTVQNLSAADNGSTVTLSWQTEEGITGYQVLRTVGSGEEERVARLDARTSQWTDTERFNGQVVSYRVRAFLKKDTNYFGGYSEKASVLQLSSLSVTKCRSADPGDLTVGWSEVAGADGFRITAVDQNGQEFSGEAAGGHRRGYVLHGLTPDMEYSATVAAYVVADGVKVYSAPSAAASARVKR